MADVIGARHTGNITQSIRKVDMKETILELEPNSYPLTVLANRLSSRLTHNPEFSWMEDTLAPRFDAINNGAGYASGATSVVVDNGAYFAADDLWKVTRTGEVILVTVVATNTLTITRGIGGGAAAIVDNDELTKLGSAAKENATSKPARSGNPTKVTNYTQIVRTPFESSRTNMHSDTFTRPADWDRSANHAGIEHAKDWEYLFWHGRPSEDVSAAPLRTTGGAFYFVQTNRTDMGGTMTEQEFFGMFSGAFRYGSSGVKTAFASRLAVDVVNSFPRGKLEMIQSDADTTYGLNVMKYRSPHGDLNFVTHNLFEGAVFGGYIAVLDMSQIAARPLGNDKGSDDTHIREQIQPNDQDGRKDEYLTEKGLEFGLEKTHAIASGITG